MNSSNESFLIALISSVLGSASIVYAAYIQRHSRHKDSIEKKLRGQIRKGKDMIKSYYELEQLYSRSMAEILHKAPKTVMEQYRKQVEEMGLVRPDGAPASIKKMFPDVQ